MTNVVNIALPDSEAMADRVVAEAARQLLTEWTADEDGVEYSINSRLAARIEQAVIDTIVEQAQALTPQIAEKVIEQGVQQTDTYGYARGEVKPLGTVIAEEVTRQLSRSGNYNSKGILNEMISKEVDTALRTELKAAMTEAKRIVTDAVTESAVKALRDAVGRSLPEVKF